MLSYKMRLSKVTHRIQASMYTHVCIDIYIYVHVNIFKTGNDYTLPLRWVFFLPLDEKIDLLSFVGKSS